MRPYMSIKDIEKNVDVAVGLLKALSNEKRLMIVFALHNNEMCVGDLCKIVGLGQSALSQHLARLRKDGLVTTRREAQTIYYSLNKNVSDIILRFLYDIHENNSES